MFCECRKLKKTQVRFATDSLKLHRSEGLSLCLVHYAPGRDGVPKTWRDRWDSFLSRAGRRQMGHENMTGQV